MTTHTLKQLHDKRAKLSREVFQLEKQMHELRADLAQIEATIRILWPGDELPKIVPRPKERRSRHFRRGALTKLILDYMREHVGEPIAVVDLMPLVPQGRTFTAAEYRRVAKGVYEALRRAERKELVSREGEGWKAARWRLAAEL